MHRGSGARCRPQRGAVGASPCPRSSDRSANGGADLVHKRRGRFGQAGKAVSACRHCQRLIDAVVGTAGHLGLPKAKALSQTETLLIAVEGAPDARARPAGCRDPAVTSGAAVARLILRRPGLSPISIFERLARAGASPTRSGPEGSSRNEPRLGRCPASHPPPCPNRMSNTGPPGHCVVSKRQAIFGHRRCKSSIT